MKLWNNVNVLDVWKVPHRESKLPANIEKAALMSKHKPQTYTMLSDDSDNDDDDDDVTVSHQVRIAHVIYLFIFVFEVRPHQPAA